MKRKEEEIDEAGYAEAGPSWGEEEKEAVLVNKAVKSGFLSLPE